ncbi:RNA polymerase sigma factor [Actinomadura rudentiformis]|uniref:RNA polymerase sigma factor n=1 Tax=Actinomadura rudentiformis TaxID=359158 RepID=UPI00298FAC5B|nr:hypothetical protein [Actinomadura rudentiformis]
MATRNPLGAEEVSDDAAIGASVADPERFAEIFHRHWEEIHRYVYRRLGPEDAEDVSAEVFTVAFRSRARYTWRVRTRGRGCTASRPI